MVNPHKIPHLRGAFPVDPGVRQGGDEDQQRGPGAEEVETWMIWKSRNVHRNDNDNVSMIMIIMI